MPRRLCVCHAELKTPEGGSYWLRWEGEADTEHQAAAAAVAYLMEYQPPGARIELVEVSTALNTSSYRPDRPRPWEVVPVSGIADRQLR